MRLIHGILAVLLFSITEIANAASIAESQPIIQHHHQQKRQLVVNMAPISSRPSLQEYLAKRQQLVDHEQQNNFESDIQLTKHEQLANRVIMAAKQLELDEGHSNPHLFNPARAFFEVLARVNDSKLFKIIKSMPKGGILHAHDTALVSTDYIVSLTYRDNLWQCNDTTTEAIVGFRFAKNAPEESDPNRLWVLAAHERARLGRTAYDTHVRTLFTLYTETPRSDYLDINDMWTKFMGIFILLEPIATYAPVWRDYYRQALTEAYADNVQYLEFRGLLPQLYDLERSNYTQDENIQIYLEVLNEFKRDHPDFIGSKFVYAPLRMVDDEKMDEYIQNMKHFHVTYPDFIAGFDLVGQEDLGRPYLDFAEKLLSLPETVKLFCHAGETNWFGREKSDENLIDAVLLGSKRIGHGFALAKHPTLMNLVKKHDIAVEVNPLSNQVLKLVEDFRNHPASVFFANNVPMVISSDDPSFWEAAPLSHDFYQAFLGIASGRSDLRTLKKLAMNSIKYSSLSDVEQQIAYGKWQLKWDQFIDDVIADEF